MEVQIGMHNNPAEDSFVYDGQKINTTLDRLGVGGISVATKEQAQNNLDVIDSAIKTLTENRAELGAMQNRVQSTVNNLNVYDENLSAANSRIRDVDMASETAELTKNNILTSAGVSVLSQANQNNLMALKLIG